MAKPVNENTGVHANVPGNTAERRLSQPEAIRESVNINIKILAEFEKQTALLEQIVFLLKNQGE